MANESLPINTGAVNAKPDKTDWLQEAIAEKYEREVNSKGDQAIA